MDALKICDDQLKTEALMLFCRKRAYNKCAGPAFADELFIAFVNTQGNRCCLEAYQSLNQFLCKDIMNTKIA
jgi:hypothetical protein